MQKRSIFISLVFIVIALVSFSAITFSVITQEIGTYTDNPAAYDALLEFGDPSAGEILFNTFQDDAGFACSTCHMTNTENRLIGPGLLNIGTRAENQVEGQSGAQYIFTSIVNSDAYVNEGFDDNLMPENWTQIYSTLEIAHIMAYLMTLDENTLNAATENDNTTPENETSLEAPMELMDSADAALGQELFNTFQPDAGFACSTCHMTNTENRLIGPGLLNVGIRAETRVEGLNNIQYIYTSIVNPDAYVNEGFDDNLMPENWAQIYSDEEIHSIMAYLLTLEG